MMVDPACHGRPADSRSSALCSCEPPSAGHRWRCVDARTVGIGRERSPQDSTGPKQSSSTGDRSGRTSPSGHQPPEPGVPHSQQRSVLPPAGIPSQRYRCRSSTGQSKAFDTYALPPRATPQSLLAWFERRLFHGSTFRQREARAKRGQQVAMDTASKTAAF